MNICFVCHEYPPLLNGGIGTFTQELAEGLVTYGVDVTVIGFYDLDSGNDFEIKKINGVKVLFFRKSKFLSIVVDRVRLALILNALDKKNNFDVVECPDFLGWGISFIGGNFKRLIRLHGSSTYFNRELKIMSAKACIWYLIEGLSLALCKNIISVSKYTACKTKSIFHLKCNPSVLYNAVKPIDGPKNPISEKCKTFIYAGSLLKKKGIIELAQAWSIFCENKSDIRLILAGKDPENNWVEFKRILGERISTVTYLGAIPKVDLLKKYVHYDCAIFPSFAEAFALAPMEAMSQGIPVIYSELTSGKELVTDGVDGFLIDPNYVISIVSMLEKVFNMSRDKRLFISDNAKELINSRFCFDEFISKNIYVYQQIIDGHIVGDIDGF